VVLMVCRDHKDHGDLLDIKGPSVHPVCITSIMIIIFNTLVSIAPEG